MIAKKIISLPGMNSILLLKPRDILSCPSSFSSTDAPSTIYEAKYAEKGYKILTRIDRPVAGLVLLSKDVGLSACNKIYLGVLAGFIVPGTYSTMMYKYANKTLIGTKRNYFHGPTRTSFDWTKKVGKFSLALIRIDSGFRHQIRAISKELRAPLVGDKLYKGPEIESFSGIALENISLDVRNPSRRISIMCPPTWEIRTLILEIFRIKYA